MPCTIRTASPSTPILLHALAFFQQSMKEEERRGLTPLQLRKKAAEFALKTVDAQREQFQRWVGWGRWGGAALCP
jgi:isoleucyl-tRNA synthetase